MRMGSNIESIALSKPAYVDRHRKATAMELDMSKFLRESFHALR